MRKKNLICNIFTTSLIFAVSGAISIGSVVASVNSAAVADETGEPTPTPRESEKVYFDSFFSIHQKVNYDETKSDVVTIHGQNVNIGFRSITYQGAKLDSKYYEVLSDCIVLSKEFVDSLPYGENEIIVYATYNQDAINHPATVIINKIKSSGEQELDSRVVRISVDTLEAGNVSQQYTIQQKSNEELDLSKLTIRYYYDDVTGKEQVFACDHAGITLDVAPYYYDASKMVTGTFEDGYLEIGFNKSYNLKNNKLTLSTRVYHSDWSSYAAGIKDGKVEVFYDGKLVKLDI